VQDLVNILLKYQISEELVGTLGGKSDKEEIDFK
jgi:hypothetical protein